MQDEIMVSVYCEAYNHEKFIRDTLDGFIKQKTNFKYEVVIHDDASTDRTAAIIQEYAERYPEIIKPILQKENQYSKGVCIEFEYLVPQLKGKYFAYCEGDDYWTDEYKLQKQYDALESHPECDMCAHAADMYDYKAKKVIKTFPDIRESRILSPEEVIYKEGNFVHTASLFYRREVDMHPMEFYKYWCIDYTLQISGSLRGGIYYIPDSMSVYRFCVPGSYTLTTFNVASMKRIFDTKQQMLGMLDEETDHKYASTIATRMLRNEFNFLKDTENFKAILDKKYRAIFQEKPVKFRLKAYIKAYIPVTITLEKFLKKQYRKFRSDRE